MQKSQLDILKISLIIVAVAILGFFLFRNRGDHQLAQVGQPSLRLCGTGNSTGFDQGDGHTTTFAGGSCSISHYEVPGGSSLVGVSSCTPWIEPGRTTVVHHSILSGWITWDESVCQGNTTGGGWGLVTPGTECPSSAPCKQHMISSEAIAVATLVSTDNNLTDGISDPLTGTKTITAKGFTNFQNWLASSSGGKNIGLQSSVVGSTVCTKDFGNQLTKPTNGQMNWNAIPIKSWGDNKYTVSCNNGVNYLYDTAVVTVNPDPTLTTPISAGCPNITTNAATYVTKTNVTLNGCQGPVTTTTPVKAWFDYSKTVPTNANTTFGTQTRVTTYGINDAPATLPIAGLTPNTKYYYHIVVQRGTATPIYGPLATFTTLP